MVSTRSSAGGEASPLLVEEAGVSAKTHGSIFGATPRRALAAIAAGAVFVFACVAFAARGGHFGVNDQLKSGFSRTGPVTDLNLANLPDVDFTGKTLLIVLGMSFSGTSALEGLLGTSGVITDLCKSNTWQCENTVLLEDMGFINENVHCDPDDVTAAEFAYAYKDFANKWWDMSKPVLMDKTPQNLCRPTKIRDAAAKLGVNVKFVVLTRHPFSWTSEKHPFNQGYYMEQMVMARNLLADPTMSTLQVRYEDMAWNMDEVIKSVKAFVPEVSAIDPWRSSLSDDSGAERGLPVGKYFQQKPLEWVQKPVTPDTYRLLCQLNYNSDGECSYFNN
tara:strand:+ start:1975 stop:2976 length:1002 start_codon:yes stop_codon:yes gene_type:complete